VIANGMLLVLTDDGVLHSFSSNAPDSAPAGIYNMSPFSGTVMSGAPPIKISAMLYDIGSGVDFNTASILIDSQPMDGLLTNITNGVISYETPIGGGGKQATNLSDGNHTITVSVKDYKGNILTKDWYIIADSSLPPPKRSASAPTTGKRTKERPRNQPQPTMPPGMESPPPPPPPPMPGQGGQF
jgi:hypothetical protein